MLTLRYRAKTRRRDGVKPPRAPRALVLDASGLRYELVRRTSPSLIPPDPSPLDGVTPMNGAAAEARRARATESRAPLSLLDGSQTFGATLLSNAQRDRLALAITSSHGTFLVGTRLDGEDDRRSFAELFARSSVVGSDESPLDATGPDGQPVCLPSETFRKLFESLLTLDPACATRLVLSDQRGTPLELDGTTLVARGARFDLSRPLEWRPIVFQEPFGHAINLYQGTWIRQGAHEVVLVSLMTPNLFESTLRGAERRAADLDRLALRDQRLLQAVAADPPPVDQRVAMDGLFVVPLRAALDEAPRPAPVESSSRHA